MPSEDRKDDPDIDQLSIKLNEGLKTCRSVVDNYRAMLRGERHRHEGEADGLEQDNYPNSPERA